MMKSSRVIAGVFVLVLFGAWATAAQASSIIFDTITGAAFSFSEGYACCRIVELGDHIQFDGSDRSLTTVTVSMKQFEFGAEPGSYVHALTLNLYSAVNPDTVIATRTENVTIATSPTSRISFDVDFDFTGVIVPNSLYYGLASQTSINGLPPGGAYDSLNFQVWNVSYPAGTTDGTVFPGTDLETIVYSRHTNLSPFVDDGSGPGSNELSDGFTPGIRFSADPVATPVPEPGTLGLVGLGLAAAASRRKKKTVA